MRTNHHKEKQNDQKMPNDYKEMKWTSGKNGNNIATKRHNDYKLKMTTRRHKITVKWKNNSITETTKGFKFFKNTHKMTTQWCKITT